MSGMPGSGYSGALDPTGPTNLRIFQWQEQLPLKAREPEAAQYPIGALGRFTEAAQVIIDQVQAPAPVVA